ncbi:helix-turn-helix transcriptional regulator [Altererythrobacter soli]|uniref:Helix-turn-helix transcriptional regulator n=1 Tax=Croceibacterium soli TaxID=1739690 RepID=A0A6I4UT33_9SPHN|nr:LuxR C-terminal-related transcriptional regulator [Croceibacterium soli]MXP40924.1 helix-turn-helix transcriptional regulator [Croceibacterium soli]
MATRPHVHVIDPDFRRRAHIAYELLQRNIHAEVYEDVEEFGARNPDEGAVLAVDNPAHCDARALIQILEGAGRLPVAVYSEEPSPARIVNAMLAGALDYLQFPFEDRLLDKAVERLTNEGDRRAEQACRRAEAKAAVEELSARELQVLVSMVQGNSNKEIAQTLGISPRTVEIHRGNMMRKLKARSSSDAIRMAVYAGLDASDDRHPIAA